jgi:hypothetical protein
MNDCIKVLLISDDVEYAGAFAEAIALARKGFVVTLAESGAEVPEDCVCLLDAGDGAEPDTLSVLVSGKQFASIDKYSGCAAICGEIELARAAASGRPLHTDCKEASALFGAGSRVQTISLVGVDGGAGVSSIAIGLADEFSGFRGRKTLYLSMERFESPCLGLCRPSGGRDISDYLFHLMKRGRGNWEPRGDVSADSRSDVQDGSAVSGVSGVPYVEPYLICNEYGALRFAPSRGVGRLRELDGGEFSLFMRAVIGEVCPDCVIFDWGSGFDDEAAAYIRASSRVVMVARHGSPKAAPAYFHAAADSLGLQDASVISIINRVPPGLGLDGVGDLDGGARGLEAGNGSAAEGEAVLSIFEDAGGFETNGEYIRVCLTNTFGTGIKELAGMILGHSDETCVRGDLREAAGIQSQSPMRESREYGKEIDELFAA